MRLERDAATTSSLGSRPARLTARETRPQTRTVERPATPASPYLRSSVRLPAPTPTARLREAKRRPARHETPTQP